MRLEVITIKFLLVKFYWYLDIRGAHDNLLNMNLELCSVSIDEN